MNLRYNILFTVGLGLAAYVDGQELKPLLPKVNKNLFDRQDSVPLLDTSARRDEIVFFSVSKLSKGDNSRMPVKKLYGRNSANMPGTEKLAEIDKQDINNVQKFTPKLLIEEKHIIKK